MKTFIAILLGLGGAGFAAVMFVEKENFDACCGVTAIVMAVGFGALLWPTREAWHCAFCRLSWSDPQGTRPAGSSSAAGCLAWIVILATVCLAVWCLSMPLGLW